MSQRRRPRSTRGDYSFRFCGIVEITLLLLSMLLLVHESTAIEDSGYGVDFGSAVPRRMSSRALSVTPCPATGNTIYDTGGAAGPYSDNEDYTCAVPCPDSSFVVEYSITYDTESGYDYVELLESGTQVEKYEGSGTDSKTRDYTGGMALHVYSDTSQSRAGFQFSFVCSTGTETPCPDTACANGGTVTLSDGTCSCDCPSNYTGDTCEVWTYLTSQ